MLDLQRLKQARIDAELTQGDVAKALGYKSENTIGMWESGRRQVKGNELGKLARLYGVSFNYLYGKTENKDFHKIDVNSHELNVIKLMRLVSDKERLAIEEMLKTLIKE